VSGSVSNNKEYPACAPAIAHAEPSLLVEPPLILAFVLVLLVCAGVLIIAKDFTQDITSLIPAFDADSKASVSASPIDKVDLKYVVRPSCGSSSTFS